MNEYTKHEYEVPVMCQGCQETMNYEMYWLLDGFDNVHPSIEELCEWCLTNELKVG